MNDHRDPTVARALDAMPVPEHGRDFWNELDARLDAEEGSDVPVTPRRFRRGWFDQRNVVMAVAAALVLVLGVVVVTADRGERTRVETRNLGETTEPPTTGPQLVGVGTADGTVNEWLEALGRGDEQAAAALVGPKSRRYIEALGGNVEGFMRESEEGYGGWAATPDRNSTEIELGTVDGVPTTIVVITGTWRGEGEDGFRASAIPAVQIGNAWMVEPVAFDADTGGRLTVNSPGPSEDGGSDLSTMKPDGVISAGAEGGGDFYFSLDDGEPVRVEGERAGGGVRASWDPPGEMPEQTHLLVIAYADGDTLTAFAGRFIVGA